jgi:two-component system, NtrC family, response regulator HydG
MIFKVLVAEDEEITLKHILTVLKSEGYEAYGTSNGNEALEKIEKENFELLIADIKMPGLTGIELLEKIKERRLDTEVIIITGYGSVSSAVDAIKKGAYDYITKPFDLDELLFRVKKIYEKKLVGKKIIALNTSLGVDKEIKSIAKSQSMKDILHIIDSIKNSDCNVLITGESGVGKNLIAKIIHNTSKRHEMPFLSINCATLTESLLASELFGHEKGAFTGAVKTKQGLMEIADTGTLFLDEISEMSTTLQAKLLMVIEDGEFYRVGGTKPFKVDVRFIAATNQNVSESISEGKFREDLYYRLNVMEIYIPPLRKRKEDIEPLSLFFLHKNLPKYGKKITEFTNEAKNLLMDYSFPGNVRELENIVERAIIIEKDSLISVDSLPESLKAFHIETLDPNTIKTLEELNKEYVESVVRMFDGNKTKAAEVLGISRTSLWRILKEE